MKHRTLIGPGTSDALVGLQKFCTVWLIICPLQKFSTTLHCNDPPSGITTSGTGGTGIKGGKTGPPGPGGPGGSGGWGGITGIGGPEDPCPVEGKDG